MLARTEEAQPTSSTRPSIEGIIGRALPPVADEEDEVQDVTSDDEGSTSKGTWVVAGNLCWWKLTCSDYDAYMTTWHVISIIYIIYIYIIIYEYISDLHEIKQNDFRLTRNDCMPYRCLPNPTKWQGTLFGNSLSEKYTFRLHLIY